MKKSLVSLLALAFLCLGASLSMAGSQDFTLVNRSASSICYVYISPSNSNDWEDDVLGADQCLEPGDSIFVRFNAGSQAVWDLRVEDDNQNSEDYHGFNLNEISEITIKGNGQASYR